MNGKQRDKLIRWIDAYCDGRLTPDQRARFESLMEMNPLLRRQVELQSQVDLSLRRLFAPPAFSGESMASTVSENHAGETLSGSSSIKSPIAIRWRRVVGWAAAAAVLLVAGTGWYAWTLMNPDMTLAPAIPHYTLSEAYREAEKVRFDATWLCKNDQEFAATFWFKFDQALAMAPPPAGLELTGLSYTSLTSSNSSRVVEVLARKGGRGVVVFVDKICKAGSDGAPLESGLFLHVKTMNKLCLKEVSPFDKPVLLDLLNEREIPEDWKKPPSYAQPATGQPASKQDSGGPRPTTRPTESQPSGSDGNDGGGKPSKWGPRNTNSGE